MWGVMEYVLPGTPWARECEVGPLLPSLTVPSSSTIFYIISFSFQQKSIYEIYSSLSWLGHICQNQLMLFIRRQNLLFGCLVFILASMKSLTWLNEQLF